MVDLDAKVVSELAAIIGPLPYPNSIRNMPVILQPAHPNFISSHPRCCAAVVLSFADNLRGPALIMLPLHLE